MNPNPSNFPVGPFSPMAPPMLGMGHPGMMPPPIYHSVSNDQTVFVGGVPSEVDESYLFGLFSQAGRIQFCKIMKDFYSGDSREFAFISYFSGKDAENAIKTMNGYKIFGKPLRVMQKKNIKDLNEKANIAIKNIDASITMGQLTQEFARFGKVISCIIRRDESKADSIGYGFVQFETEEAANNAMETMNGKPLNGRDLVIEPFVNAKNRAQPESSNLYFKQFPQGWTQAQVEEFFAKEVEVCGTILSKGIFPKFGSFYAFAAFEKAENAKKALELLNGKKLTEDGEPLYVGLALTKNQRSKKMMQEKLQRKNDTNLYVRSIKPEVKKEDLKAAFEKFGTVTSVLLKTWTPEPRGETPAPTPLQFGFVNFEKEEDALKAQTGYKACPEVMAIIEANETGKFVFFAQPKRIREQFLRMQKHNASYMMRMNRQRMPQFPMQQPPRSRNPKQRGPGNFPHGHFNMSNIQLPNSIQTPQTPPRPITPSEPNKEAQILKRMENPTSNIDLCTLINSNITFFESLPEEKKKKILGHEMFKRVKEKCSTQEMVPKITGMLIDFDVLTVPQMLEIIEDDAMLEERVQEAISILNNPEQ